MRWEKNSTSAKKRLNKSFGGMEVGLISVGLKVTFLRAQKKFSKAGCLIYCPDPKLEHSCLGSGSKEQKC